MLVPRLLAKVDAFFDDPSHIDGLPDLGAQGDDGEAKKGESKKAK